MEKEKWRVVCFVNQFFGQIGGEDMAHVGFTVREEAVGPAQLFARLMQKECQVVGTVICGDNYFAEHIDQAVQEGVELVRGLAPDLFIAGPAFNAGRYGISCGNMASAVVKALHIPTVTGMYPENPAVEMFRKDTYILKTGILSSEMRKVGPRIASLALRLLQGEHIGSAAAEGYINRDIILNEEQESNAAHRAIEMVLKKIRGEEFVSELLPPNFDVVEPAPPIDTLRGKKLALVTDGGIRCWRSGTLSSTAATTGPGCWKIPTACSPWIFCGKRPRWGRSAPWRRRSMSPAATVPRWPPPRRRAGRLPKLCWTSRYRRLS